MFVCSHAPRKKAYKIQLHCHTTESDGQLSPADAMLEYKRLGFDAVAITDHDSLTTAPTADPGGHGMLFIMSIEESFSIPAYPERTAHMTAVGTSFYYPDPPDGTKPSGHLPLFIPTALFVPSATPALSRPVSAGSAIVGRCQECRPERQEPYPGKADQRKADAMVSISMRESFCFNASSRQRLTVSRMVATWSLA